MERYEDKIEKALLYLKSPSKLSPTGYSPIVYMVYQPEDAFVVRGLTDTFLKPKAEYNGFHVHEISMGEVIDKFINTKSCPSNPKGKERLVHGIDPRTGASLREQAQGETLQKEEGRRQ